MRLTVQIWMFLALLLVVRTVAKATEDDVIDIDAGSGEGDVAEIKGQTVDDEDNTEGTEMGSGTDLPLRPNIRSGPTQPIFENTIRIHKIGNQKATFKPAHNDPNSAESKEVFAAVCSVLTSLLQENQISSQSCIGVSITKGSLIVETKIVLAEGSTAFATDVEGALRDSLGSGDRLSDGSTSLSVDPASIAVAPSRSVPEVVPTSEPSPEQPKKPETPSTVQTNKGNQENDIFFPTTAMPAKPSKDTMSTAMSNEIGGHKDDGDHSNSLGVKDKKDKNQNFFDMILGSPLLLAALVGAVVLTLITIILIVMFMIYRVKKKDEGSYSLDEPHKVKDPTTYWKDTKEFYA